MKNMWLDGMMGLVVGDALGVPVQFMSREEIRERAEGPVTGMESGGVYEMPEGTWSDDSSMALATLASLKELGRVDLKDIMDRFVDWEYNGAYTPFGEAFDEGNTCSMAIFHYAYGTDVKHCGKTGEHANGNGALMRILPACLHLLNVPEDEAINAIHDIGALTHNHLRSQMCCGFYYFMVKRIVAGEDLAAALQNGMDDGLKYYGADMDNHRELVHLKRMLRMDELKNIPEAEIRTSGYVIDTFEAAVWCLLNTDSYRECCLKAVNMGDDTDTVAAIAGGLAGLYYGYDSIPQEWLSVIKKREWIEKSLRQTR